MNRDWNRDLTLQALEEAAETYYAAKRRNIDEKELDTPVEVNGEQAYSITVNQDWPEDDDITLGPAIIFHDEHGNEITRVGWEAFGEAPIPLNLRPCKLRGCTNYRWWWELDENICNDCLDQNEFCYVGRFGIIIPKETGIYWRQQTKGVMCHHVDIEGIYLPLREPTEWTGDERIDLLSELRNANYNHDADRRKELWEHIRNELKWEFEWVDPPSDDYPNNQEALRWIKITKAYDGGYFWSQPGENLEGKTVALVYPNCD